MIDPFGLGCQFRRRELNEIIASFGNERLPRKVLGHFGQGAMKHREIAFRVQDLLLAMNLSKKDNRVRISKPGKLEKGRIEGGSAH